MNRPRAFLGVILLIKAAICLAQMEDDKGNAPRQVAQSETEIQGCSTDFICLRDHGTREPYARPATSFAQYAVLEVSINDPHKLLNPRSASLVESYFVRATESWNYACLNCGANNLLLVKVGTNLYPNRWAATVFRSFDIEQAGIPPGVGEVIADLDLLVFNMRRAAKASGICFEPEPLKLDDRIVRNLCLYPLQRLPLSFQAVRLALDCPGERSHRTDLILKVSLMILDGYTHCAKSDDVFGCGYEGVIELDARHHAFVAHNESQLLFGKGEDAIDLLKLLVHEEGHWIGLTKHFGQSGMMANNFLEATCIDDEVVARLRNITALKEPAQKRKETYAESPAQSKRKPSRKPLMKPRLSTARQSSSM
jgi:hypothetical protein